MTNRDLIPTVTRWHELTATLGYRQSNAANSHLLGALLTLTERHPEEAEKVEQAMKLAAAYGAETSER